MTLIRYGLAVLAVAQGGAACARGSERPSPDTSTAAAAPTDTALARADSLYLERDIDGARAIWVPALASAEARGDSTRVARLLTSLGLAHRSQGEYAQARDLLERSLTLKQRLGMRDDLFRSLNALGLLASDEGRLNDAVSFYQRAADAALARGDSLSAAKAGHNLGLIHHRLGDFERAREGFARLRDVARVSGDTVSLARALNNVAMLDVTSGNTLSAIAALDEIRRLAGASGDVELQENALGQLALAFDELGDGRRAFALLDSALALTRAHGLRRQEGEDLRLMGDLYRDAGDYRRALDSFAGARSIVESLDLPEETGDVLLSEAEAQFALGQVDLAMRRASDALRMHRSGGFRFAELIDLCVLAELAQTQERAAEALAYLRSARVLADALGADVARADVTMAEARVADLAGNAARVLATLDVPSPGVAEDWEAHALRARAYARLGRLEAAAAAGRQALAGVERVRGGYPAGTLRSLYTSAKSDIYADQVVVLLRLGRVAEAFEVADAGRGRALVEHLAVARDDIRRSSGGAQSLVEAERLLARIDTLVARLRAAQLTRPPERGATGADERELASQLAAARSAYETLLVRATREDPASAALLGGARSGAGAVQRSLLPDEALIAYTVTNDRLLIFVVTSDSIRSITATVTGEELANRVRLARELLARHDLDANQSSSVLKGLYRLLLGEAVTMLEPRGTHRLLLVPHRSLAYLPFAALQDDDGRFLIQRFSLVHLSAASVLPAIRSPARARSPTVSSGRSIALAPFPDALPATRGEAAQFRRTVRPSDGLIGARATEAALRAALGRGGIVHIATHGFMNPRNPMFSRVELAAGAGGTPDDDGRFEVHELLGVTIRSDLVFLSGCETGLGGAWSTSFDRTDDYATLAQAFLFAGARNVVGTLWRINDESAAAFAGRFYGFLERSAAADALALAQRAMIADARYATPYYWAGYQVSGEGAGSTHRQ